MGAFKRIAATVLACGVVLALACVDMSAPKGPASVSLLQVPALFIVVNDTMRDTNGVAAKPSLIAFDAAGTPSIAADAQFFTTDTLPVATFNAAGQLVAKALGSIHLIGQVGHLQTPPLTITITPAGPDSVVATAGDTAFHLILAGDSAATTQSTTVSAIVKMADQTPMPGVFVQFSIAPHPSTQKYAAVFLTDDPATANSFSPIDTSDASGTVTKRLVVIASALDSTRIGLGDTAVVTVTAKYKGAPLKGSPLVVKIPLKPPF